MMSYHEIPKNSWLWKSLDELDTGFSLGNETRISKHYAGAVEIRTTSPRVPNGTAAMLIFDRQIFVDREKLKSGALTSTLASILDGAVLHTVTFSLIATLIQTALIVKFISDEEAEFLDVLIGHVGANRDPLETFIPVADLSRSYSDPDNYNDGTKETLQLVDRLVKKGVLKSNTNEINRSSSVKLQP
jgi:hypothetical protein